MEEEKPEMTEDTQVPIELEQKDQPQAYQEDSLPLEGAVKATKFKLKDTPKVQHPVIVWFKQLYIMIKTDSILTFIRYWKSTIINILAPIAFLLLLYIIQEVALTIGIPQALHPVPYLLPPVESCTSGKHPCINILFAPDNAETRQIMTIFDQNNQQRLGTNDEFSVTKLTNTDPPTQELSYASVPSESDLYNYIVSNSNVTQWGILFNIQDNKYIYQVWYNDSLTSNTTQSVSEYYAVSLTSMIRGVDEAIIQYLQEINNLEKTEFRTSLKDWPTKAYPGISGDVVAEGGPMFFFCSAMVNFLMILNQIVSEKENKLRHGMEMMGLKPSVYWASWLLVNFVVCIFSSLVTCIFGIAFGFEVFTSTDFRVMFTLFLTFSTAMIFFAFFISTMARRVAVATLIGIFILIIGLVFMLAIFSTTYVASIFWETTTNPAGWIVLMFLPFFNFGKLYSDIALLAVGTYSFSSDSNIGGPGFHWSDLYQQIPTDLLPSFGTYHLPLPVRALYLLMMDMVFYALLTWYLDNVIPDEFGNGRPVYFFLTPSYWGIKTLTRRRVIDLQKLRAEAEKEQEDEDVHEERFEALKEESESAAIRLLHLRKVYKPGLFASGETKIAVNGSSFTLQEGKLLALLGQNGAGKSTTINMMCGFSKPTSGDAFIFGKSIVSDMSEIRSMMGVCPQHDILFRDLTAKEHIELYAGIKNIPRHLIPQIIKERLEAVKLDKVQNKCAGTYSGGMKRRLSVAISTIGNPKIIFLDEPTTGMDPVNRRHVWSFIQNFKEGRVIVLTTHSMEEADILGDQIAIMALGKLRAFGSSVHLKGRFGAGYRISLVTLGGTTDKVKEEISKRIPESILEDDSAGALIYKIPKSSFDSIPPFVRSLEDKEIEGIKEWGISQATLEEVFLKLIRDVNPTSTEKKN